MDTHDESVGEFVLELVSHYRLLDKPVRTFEALRIFLHREADEAYAELRAGRAFVVRRGDRQELEQLLSAMQAQGFVLRLRVADRD
ncbi:MAG: hypothetical protein CL625_04660 [Arenimonas sp.]|nr:hypothetical protein [Arenimonas sp.]